MSNNADIDRVKELKEMQPGMFQAKQVNVDPKQFADMLGIPFSSLQMLLKEHHEKDPSVKQSIHEHVSFIKLQEGYPLFFSESNQDKHNFVTTVPSG